MSIETCDRLVGKFELYALLEKGLDDMQSGRVSPAHEAMAEIRTELKNGTL